jgi:hypothetical protein
MNAKKLPPSSRPTAFAPATVRSRKMRSGISGSSARDSMIRKVTIRAADATSRVMVRADHQPSCGAFDSA